MTEDDSDRTFTMAFQGDKAGTFTMVKRGTKISKARRNGTNCLKQESLRQASAATASRF